MRLRPPFALSVAANLANVVVVIKSTGYSSSPIVWLAGLLAAGCRKWDGVIGRRRASVAHAMLLHRSPAATIRRQPQGMGEHSHQRGAGVRLSVFPTGGATGTHAAVLSGIVQPCRLFLPFLFCVPPLGLNHLAQRRRSLATLHRPTHVFASMQSRPLVAPDIAHGA